MKRQLFAVMALGSIALGASGSAHATSINPLADGGWSLVAHMSNQGGMFDGNGDLQPTYSYGTFDPNPSAATPDFERAFPFPAKDILFITGDLSVWGIADYASMSSLINAAASDPSPNLPFEIYSGGTISNVTGNVLSRGFTLEDPWISINGNHFSGIANQFIVWGENDYQDASGHEALKNSHGGINVYIRDFTAQVPEPATFALISLGLAGIRLRRNA